MRVKSASEIVVIKKEYHISLMVFYTVIQEVQLQLTISLQLTHLHTKCVMIQLWSSLFLIKNFNLQGHQQPYQYKKKQVVQECLTMVVERIQIKKILN